MRIDESTGIRVLHIAAEGAPISTPDDAADLVGDAWANQAELVAVPVERLDPAFFDLRTGIAGEITQKLVNYRLRLAVVGDIAQHVDASAALRDYVWESNRGAQVWFVADDAALEAKLAGVR
ncbi:DUF4180 domain-containing protein [Agromyces sp. SYSU K20354]|uniref:DUF4180 domain-containing protein n=1 Tax=Agromyces cavernae TaxID=2898659 RepID=UPI001E61AE25|nr:DUF4180 domain-containing protein [Agromyces cavernae]MCD2442711.1 DUF4180 domain-containing protein [Agromyces cavernae]